MFTIMKRFSLVNLRLTLELFCTGNILVLLDYDFHSLKSLNVRKITLGQPSWMQLFWWFCWLPADQEINIYVSSICFEFVYLRCRKASVCNRFCIHFDGFRAVFMNFIGIFYHYKSFLVRILSLKEVFDIFGIKAQKGSKPILHSFTNASLYITKYYGI